MVNGVGTDGLAGAGSAAIRAQGFTNVSLGATTGGRLRTEIAYDPPFKAVADQLATLFPGARTTVEPGSEGVTVTLGRDYRPVPPTATASASRPVPGGTPAAVGIALGAGAPTAVGTPAVPPPHRCPPASPAASPRTAAPPTPTPAPTSPSAEAGSRAPFPPGPALRRQGPAGSGRPVTTAVSRVPGGKAPAPARSCTAASSFAT